MEKLKDSEQCKKCEGYDVKVRWRPAWPHSLPAGSPEKMLVTCISCEYTWLRAPMDAQDEIAEALK